MISSQIITAEYEKTRAQHRKTLDEKKQVLYKNFPRLASIEQEMIALGIDISKSVLFAKTNQEQLIEELEAKQYLLRKERWDLLQANHYDKDYLELQYTCKKCKDTGFVDQSICKCYKQKAIIFAYNQSNLKEVLSYQNFDYFDFSYYSTESFRGDQSPRQNIEEIYNNCLNYVHGFDHHNENLLFIGSPGLGKTFMSHCMAKYLLDSEKTVIYQLCGDLVDLVRRSKYDFDKEELHDLTMRNIYGCDFLIIDDFGTEVQSNFASQVLYDIINKRIISKKNTLLVTNLEVQGILQYSERIHSRILGEFSMYEFLGDDIRMKKNRK